MSERQTFIYFIKPVGQDGPVKIGCTRFVDDRLNHLMHWSPVPLEVSAIAPGDFRLERFIHNRFVAQSLHKEWFSPSPALMAAIARVKDGEPLESVFGPEPRFRKRWGQTERHYVPATEPERAAS